MQLVAKDFGFFRKPWRIASARALPASCIGPSSGVAPSRATPLPQDDREHRNQCHDGRKCALSEADRECPFRRGVGALR